VRVTWRPGENGSKRAVVVEFLPKKVD
jgi:hypothetical protein